MKQTILAFAVVITLASCGGSTTTKQTTTDSTTTDSTKACADTCNADNKVINSISPSK